MSWIAAGLAAGSLIASLVTLNIVMGIRRSALRAERAGDERLEILREQQERLQFLREERRVLEEEVQWRRSVMEGEERPLEIVAPIGSNGHARDEGSKLHVWLRKVIGR